MLEVLKQLMNEQNITSFYQLSKLVGISATSFTDWKAERSKPSAAALIKFADFFNVSVDYLLGRTTNREPYRS